MIKIAVFLVLLVAGVASGTVVQADSHSPMTATMTTRSSSSRILQEDLVQNNCGSHGLGIACPAGCWAIFQHYDETEGLVHCQVVTKLGYYSLERSTLLRPCDEGFFSNEIRASSCRACPLGSFAPGIGNSDCTPCPSGYYQDEIGQRECKQCSSYYYAGEGSMAATSGQFCQLEASSSAPSIAPTPAPFLDVTKAEIPSSMPGDTKNGAPAAPSFPSESSATNAPSTTENGTTILLPAKDPWKGPFVVAAVSLGSIFIIALVSLMRQKRPGRERDDMLHDFTNGCDDHVLNRGNPHLGIPPLHPPEIHDEEEEDEAEARDELPTLSPLPPRDLDNGVPEAARPAFVTPYHPEREEGKFPDDSFDSFAHCYEDPEIAQNFPDHNDSTMAVVSQAVLLPGDPTMMDAPNVDEILFPESFAAARGGSSPTYSLRNAVFPEYNMSPMSGSFDL